MPTEFINWQPIMLAPAEEEVLTKIHDDDGERNVAKLTRRGNLWFTREGTYVYYQPTHFVPNAPSTSRASHYS